MRVAVVDLLSNFVVNAIVADVSDPCPDTFLLVASESAERGWTYDPANGELLPPPSEATEPVDPNAPFEISPRQLMNRIPIAKQISLRMNADKLDTDESKDQTGAQLYLNLIGAATINVRSPTVIQGGAYLVGASYLTQEECDYALAAVIYDGETRAGLMG